MKIVKKNLQVEDASCEAGCERGTVNSSRRRLIDREGRAAQLAGTTPSTAISSLCY